MPQLGGRSGGRRLALALLLIATALALSSPAPKTTFPGTSGDVPAEVTVQIATGADNGATSAEYGLLELWQDAYSGSGNHGYNLNDSNPGLLVTEECGNCHMEDSGTSASWTNKHRPPLHPIAVEGTSGSNFTGKWFHDQGNHRGPNVRLASQDSGILPGTQCGACHTPNDPSSAFGPGVTDDFSQLTNDPHSVHRDVFNREGCIRCHVFDNETFDRTGNGNGGISFTQGNATHDSYGIANPINMTRVWDGVFLSTTTEAAYSYSAGGGGLSSSGSGWNRYGNTESGRASQYGCGDCHDRFHAEQAYADTGGNGLVFAFDESPSSRKGPIREVKDTNSVGVNASGTMVTCGACHPTDAHAVHTNGKINSRATLLQVEDASDQSIINSGVLGAELCDECHSQNVRSSGSGTTKHTSNQAERGLAGIQQQFGPSSHNRLPDLSSGEAGSENNDHEDCGFCHYRTTLN